MAEAKLSRLITKRTTIINQQIRIKQFVESITPRTSIPELETRLNALERYYDKFCTTQAQIEDVNENEVTEKTRAEYEESYFDLRPALLVEISKRNREVENKSHVHNDTSLNDTVSGTATGIKLPKITLPTFSGDYSKWITFHETFTALVHNNKALDNVSRFHYLRSALSQGALRSIQSIEVTAENYESARKILIERFNNKKLISQEHIRLLFSIPAVNKASSDSLRELIDTVNVHLRALENLGRPVLQWDDLIVFHVLQKLDSITRDKWEDECSSDRLPTLNEVFTFLEKRCHSLEAKGRNNSSDIQQNNSKPNSKTKPQRHANSTSLKVEGNQETSTDPKVLAHQPQGKSAPWCAYCAKSDHIIYRCGRFLNLSPGERLTEITRLKLCLNCLHPNHNAETCYARKCQLCNKQHNTLLHNESLSNKNTSLVTVMASDITAKSLIPCSDNFELATASTVGHSALQTSVTPTCQSRTHILLATVVIQVLNKHKTYIACRALLDSGSQLNFISEHMLQELGLKRTKTNIPISGIGNFEVVSKHKTNLLIKSRLNSFTINIEALTLPKISGMQPDIYINTKKWDIPSHVELADPTFYEPQKIDILIGAEFFSEILGQEKITLQRPLLSLQKTQFGWIVMGKVPEADSKRFYCNIATKPQCAQLERQVQAFWEIERHDSPIKTHSREEELCENHFNQTTKRLSSGQYTVRLPFRKDAEYLGNSQNMATRRFLSLERKLSRNPDLYKSYCEFMTEYSKLNHMQPIAADDIPYPNYFLPHHCVEKLESSTTKLRVVFDASAKSSSGASLNDSLMTGPVVQPDLFSIVTRFRTYRYVFTADISKMYRQILVDPADRKYQLIVWRDSSTKNLNVFQLNTITYGTSAAPYLATRCLNQLADDEYANYPKACNTIRTSFYVDDCMTGSDNLQEAQRIQADLIAVLRRGHFELRKFCANHPSLLQNIPKEQRERYLNINGNKVVKTLGLIWQPEEDIFQLHIAPSALKHSYMTKRTILSDLASIFDPLGFIAPVVVLGKIFLQELWKLKLSWDATLPENYQNKWIAYREQLHELNALKIPRRLMQLENIKGLQLHVFADSSEAAYGACVYLRCLNSINEISIQLVCAKSRVSPIKNTSLPRLELCAAVLAAELVERLLNTLHIDVQRVYYYSDSSIVLSWIKAPSYTWTTFVANRVAKIQDLTRIEQWSHISSEENPADVLSRGVLPKAFISNATWFNGPEFLLRSKQTWFHDYESQLETIPERRNPKSCLLTAKPADLIETVRHSNSFEKLKRIFAYCCRFTNNARTLHSSRSFGALTAQELEKGLNPLIKYVQRSSFPEEYKSLKTKTLLFKSSRLLPLSPFLDPSDIIRVGGRLRNASIPFERKHQIVLPKNHCVTKMLLSHIHVKNFHAAPQTLLTICRQKYWPLDGKTLARQVVHHCIRCFRCKPRTIEHIMGDLPEERVQPGRAFLTTGIDFCGPFKVHFRIRGRPPVKAYVAVFVCFTTKATHLELVSDLSSEAFLCALKRFISRRGLCRKIFCDNATNFLGATSILHELRQLLLSQQCQNQIQQFCQQDHIEWRPIPPRSPHFGGLWEAAVKAAKHHLVRTVSMASLTYEELHTVICQVEAILNSRPLTALSADPNDLEPLTPGHFLIGGPISSFPEPDVTNDRYEYLQQLQQRHKWNVPQRQLNIGELVLLKEDNLPPLQWKLGRVTRLFPGKDSVIRVAEVKTQYSSYIRAIVKLCPLPMESPPS